MERIAVIIPCYNESRTIEKVVSDFRAALPQASIYVYDNNSTDGTAERAMDAGAVVRFEFQQGKGCVIRRMFREIDAECYIMVDGDDTYPAEAAPAMAQKVLEHHADMVVGDRLSSSYFSQNKRPFHSLGNCFVRKSINMLFHSDIKDIMTGYRAFSYQFAKTFPVLSRGFEIETEMSIHAIDKNMFVENFVIAYRDRPHGSVSKLNTTRDGWKVLTTILRLFWTYHPLSFWGVITVVLAFVSLAFFAPVLLAFFETHSVQKFPTLIVCGFVMVAAIQALFTGLTLHSILVKNKQDFEMELHAVHREYCRKRGTDGESDSLQNGGRYEHSCC